jgi:hypothetical protein
MEQSESKAAAREAAAARAIAAYAAHEAKAAQREACKASKADAYDTYLMARAAYNAAEIAYHSSQARADYQSAEAALIKAAGAFHDACALANGIDKANQILSAMRKGKRS